MTRPSVNVKSTESIVVFTTSDNLETLEQITRQSVVQNLAACCQISGPITSHYTWEGKPESSTEWQCQIKTTVDAYSALEKLIQDLHHYDEPEIIYFHIDGGSESYLKWIADSVRPSD